jgi:tetratricopeptide (TPR) repeat protein
VTKRWVFLCATLAAAACGRGTAPADDQARERAYRENNRGVALLEQFQYAEAAAAFRRAFQIDASVAIARLNLSLALFHAQELPAAAAEAAAAARLLPALPHPPYVLGLIARAENRVEEAQRHFQRVREMDAGDAGAHVHLGQIHLEERRYPEAIAALREAVRIEPFNVTATYNLGLALTRAGQADEGNEVLSRAQALRTVGYAVTYGAGYLEQGRYAEAVASTGAEPDLVEDQVSAAAFTASPVSPRFGAGDAPREQLFGQRFTADDLSPAGARALAANLAGAMALVDVEPDGDHDIIVATPGLQRLYLNDGRGGWTEATASSGIAAVPPESFPIGAVAGDYDNDGRADLFVLRHGVSSLYRNEGGGRFRDATQTSRLTPYPHLPGAVAWTDVDHDGDADLVIAGLADLTASRQRAGGAGLRFPQDFSPAPLRLWRNNGNGTFTDATTAARLDVTARAIAIVPTDFDNRRDVDLLVVNAGGPPLLLQNLRDGTFRDAAGAAGLAALVAGDRAIAAASVADVNKDDFPDVFFAHPAGGTLAVSDGRGRFTIGPTIDSSSRAFAAQFADYDNDGLLDLVVWADEAPQIFRNLGRRWVDVSARAFATRGASAPGPSSSRMLALADLNGDGATDLVTAGAAGIDMWQNSGDPARRSQSVKIRGRVSNRSGIGSKVQLRAGSLIARLELSASSPAVVPSDAVFGLGRRTAADAVRIIWPSGILQAETLAEQGAAAANAVLNIEELDRKPSSCPFLFTWNGDRFEFVTDFLGGGEMGYLHGPGVLNVPDPTEDVRIRGDQLRPRDGRLELRVTNELEEALFVDRLQLIAVAHPAAIEVHPNEGMTSPPKPDGLHGATRLRVPRVTDAHGHDVTARVAHLDRQYPDDFTVDSVRGYATLHHLDIDFAPAGRAPILLLTGWTGYAFSSDNVAASQAGLVLSPPALQVKDRSGRWRTAMEQIGIPVGRPQTIAVNLAGRLRPGEHEVRIVTSMRVYWDRILVGEAAEVARVEQVTLPLSRATLVERGFSAELRPDGREPTLYDYDRVATVSPWKTMIGRYTRVGDVAELLTAADDIFVIARPGDEVALAFDAAALTPLPDGWTRTFLLRAVGYSKEMDINSATPDRVEPLPFRRMTRYPYAPPERYPEQPEHERYRTTYNTRVVVRSVPSIDAHLP